MEEILEQPTLDNNDVSCAETESNNQEGSIFGKFKDAQTLLDAYNNLQAEFTRKSQKLAEFQKNTNENAIFENDKSLDEILKSTGKEDYKKRITEILNEDENLNNLPNKYHVAIKIIEEAENKTAEKLNDQNYIDEYLLNNENIKKKIISEYLSKLNNISSIPKIISGNSTNIYTSANTNSPKTLKEAGEIFSKMLK